MSVTTATAVLEPDHATAPAGGLRHGPPDEHDLAAARHRAVA